MAEVRDYRQVIDGLIADHGGRVFGSAEDSVVAEFAVPLRRCAALLRFKLKSKAAMPISLTTVW